MGFLLGLGSTPKPPPPPPNPATMASGGPQMSGAQTAAAAAAAAGQGLNDTLKTSSQGAAVPNVANKTVLGG